MKNYTLFVKLQILCNIKAVSFAYPLENFTLDWIFYTTSGCDGCDKYQVCCMWSSQVMLYWLTDTLWLREGSRLAGWLAVYMYIAHCTFTSNLQSTKHSCGQTAISSHFWMNYFHFDNEVESKADKSQSKYSAGFPEHFVFAKWNKFLGMWFHSCFSTKN